MLSWIWKASPTFSGDGTLEWEIGFESNGTHYDRLSITYDTENLYRFITYCLGDRCDLVYDLGWQDSAYRNITFDTLPDALLYSKLSTMATVDGLISKIEVNGVPLLDLTSDTVTAATLARGVYAHDKTGKRIRGTMVAGTNAATLMAVSSENTGTLTIVNDSQQKIGVYNTSNTMLTFDQVIDPGEEYTYDNIPTGNMFGIVGIEKGTLRLESDGPVGILNYTCYDVIASPYAFAVSTMGTNATITLE